MQFAAVHMVANGTKRTSRPVRLMSAIGGKADIARRPTCLLLTQSGHRRRICSSEAGSSPSTLLSRYDGVLAWGGHEAAGVSSVLSAARRRYGRSTGARRSRARAPYRRAAARSLGRSEFQARVGAFLQALALWAGPSAATCTSTPAGPRPMPPKFADTRRNWPRSRPTSSWPMAPDRRGIAAGDPHRADRVPDRRRSGRRRIRR